MLVCLQAQGWSARGQSQEASESHLANGHIHSTVIAHDTNSDVETDSEEGAAEPAHQQAPPAVALQPNGIAHQYTNGHAQPEAQLRHSGSSESEEEDDDGEEEAEGGTEAMQVQCKFHCVVILSGSTACVVQCSLHCAKLYIDSCYSSAVHKCHAGALRVRQGIKHST